jgi:MoaA/NifB/PqqE/SkfB family radical SAM enzyme
MGPADRRLFLYWLKEFLLGIFHRSGSLDEVRAHVVSVYQKLDQPPPSRRDLNRTIRRAIREAGSVGRLIELASLERLDQVIDVRPLRLEIDIVSKCNLRRSMCMMSRRSHYKRPLQRMSLEDFESLARETFRNVSALSFTYGAEPLLHPDFPRFIEVADRYRTPNDYAVTNGMLLSNAITQAMVTHGLRSLAVSVDAACPETYGKIRIGGEWGRLMQNLLDFQRIKRELGSQTPHLELNFVMMKTNIGGLPEFVDLAANPGATAVNATHMVPFESLGMENESCALLKETTNEMLTRAKTRARNHGLQFIAPQLFNEGAAYNSSTGIKEKFGLPISQATERAGHCPFPWHFAAIDMLRYIVPCGWWANQSGTVSIKSEPFLSIWKSETYRDLRAEHKSGDLRAACRNCPAAGIGCVDAEKSFLERYEQYWWAVLD